jgi:hypothetical protein
MNPLKQFAKQLVRNATRPRFRAQNTIALTGTPRSGTTWIAEVLQQRLGLDLINEPLHLTRSPKGKEHGFSWMTCIEPQDDRPAATQYLADIITGKVNAGWHVPFPDNQSKQYFGRPRKNLLVKFVRANRMLGWLAKQIEFATIVYVVRHPCAVVASKMAMGKREDSPWSKFEPPAPDEIQTAFDGWIPDRVSNNTATSSDLPKQPPAHLHACGRWTIILPASIGSMAVACS